jgi:hypothetical protein
MNKNEIEQDIWDWIINYLEAPHAFYNYKFPPCPYARAARVKNLIDVKVYETGSINLFIENCTHDLIESTGLNTRILVFPHYVRWFYLTKWFVQRLNRQTVPKDYYLQYGRAIRTESKYIGWFSNKPYFIVIVNKLSDVLKGHQDLLKTDYYNNWSQQHYKDVVIRRQKMFDKYHSGSLK